MLGSWQDLRTPATAHRARLEPLIISLRARSRRLPTRCSRLTYAAAVHSEVAARDPTVGRSSFGVRPPQWPSASSRRLALALRLTMSGASRLPRVRRGEAEATPATRRRNEAEREHGASGSKLSPHENPEIPSLAVSVCCGNGDSRPSARIRLCASDHRR